MAKKAAPKASETDEDLPECFVIMPISEVEGYPAQHFRKVFKDIFVPACQKAGYKAVRADQDAATNMIHVEVVRKVVEAPMVLCDLSTRNPNVLFELGIRQAFDKPVALVRDDSNEKIFDVDILRYATYRRSRCYDEVLADQKEIARVIKATAKNSGVNSLIRLLGISKPAELKEGQEPTLAEFTSIIRAEMDGLRSEMRSRKSIPARQTPLQESDQANYDAIFKNLRKMLPTVSDGDVARLAKSMLKQINGGTTFGQALTNLGIAAVAF